MTAQSQEELGEELGRREALEWCKTRTTHDLKEFAWFDANLRKKHPRMIAYLLAQGWKFSDERISHPAEFGAELEDAFDERFIETVKSEWEARPDR